MAEEKEAKWYVVHTYSGYENKVKTLLEKTIANRGMQEIIQDIYIPTEDIIEIKDGKKKPIKRKKYPGYVFPRGDAEGNFLGDVFDPELTVDSWRHAVSTGRFSGETVIVLDSSFAKQYRFPVIRGERFFTEGYVWLQMTEDFLWSHDVICVGNYLDDGLTKSIMRVFASSPVSHMMYNNLRLSIWKPFLKRFKFAAYYYGFAMFAHEKRFISKASSRPMALAALPFGRAGIVATALEMQWPIVPALFVLACGCSVFIVLAGALSVRLRPAPVAALVAGAVLLSFVWPVRALLPEIGRFWLVDRLAGGGTMPWGEAGAAISAAACLVAFWLVAGSMLLQRRELP